MSEPILPQTAVRIKADLEADKVYPMKRYIDELDYELMKLDLSKKIINMEQALMIARQWISDAGIQSQIDKALEGKW